jgi:hypothetical protein
MEKHHQDALTLRLEDAYLNGCSHVTWDDLYYWYGVEKIAARTYRDLEARWQTITEGEEGPLMRVEGRGGIFLFGGANTKAIKEI